MTGADAMPGDDALDDGDIREEPFEVRVSAVWSAVRQLRSVRAVVGWDGPSGRDAAEILMEGFDSSITDLAEWRRQAGNTAANAVDRAAMPPEIRYQVACLLDAHIRWASRVTREELDKGLARHARRSARRK